MSKKNINFVPDLQYAKMRRYIVTIILTLIGMYYSTAAIKWNSAYQNYIDKYKDIAIEQMRTYRIPASITLAQGLLESGAGLSRLATQANNHFGIKCQTPYIRKGIENFPTQVCIGRSLYTRTHFITNKAMPISTQINANKEERE